MNWQLYIEVFALFVIQLSIAMVMLTPEKLSFRFKKPWMTILSIVGALVISLGGAFLACWFCVNVAWNVWVNIGVYLFMTVCVFGSYYLVYPAKISQALLINIVAYTIQHMAYQFMEIVFNLGLNRFYYNAFYENSVDTYNLVYKITLYTGYVASYIVAYFAICRPYIKNCKYIFHIRRILVIGVAELLIINAVNAVAQNYNMWWNWQGKAMQAISLFSFCILLDIIVIGCFKLVEKQQEQLLLEANFQTRLEEEMRDRDSIAFINVKCHDLRKKIRFIKENKELLSNEDLNQLEEALRIYDIGVKTGCEDIDMLLQARTLYCQAKNIEFTSLIDGNVFEDFEANDIFFLLMNIIDNAIEAADKVEDKAKRIVTIKASRQQGCILITERNYFVGTIEKNKDGSLKTTKKDENRHGFGTKSVAQITKKYNGTLHYEISDDIFELKIAF